MKNIRRIGVNEVADMSGGVTLMVHLTWEQAQRLESLAKSRGMRMADLATDMVVGMTDMGDAPIELDRREPPVQPAHQLYEEHQPNREE